PDHCTHEPCSLPASCLLCCLPSLPRTFPPFLLFRPSRFARKLFSALPAFSPRYKKARPLHTQYTAHEGTHTRPVPYTRCHALPHEYTHARTPHTPCTKGVSTALRVVSGWWLCSVCVGGWLPVCLCALRAPFRPLGAHRGINKKNSLPLFSLKFPDCPALLPCLSVYCPAAHSLPVPLHSLPLCMSV
ncbi:hypothetical protein NEQG_02716, partial [Nematocida parisii ERTm3]